MTFPASEAPVAEIRPQRRDVDRRTPLIRHGSDAAAIADIALLRVAAGCNALRHAVLSGPVLVGRDPECTLYVDHPSVSRRHARVEPDGAGGFVAVDLGSRNGTFVNTQRVQEAPLAPGDLIEVGSVVLRLDYVSAVELEHLDAALQQVLSAQRDPLTGLLTRKWIEERLPGRLLECDRQGQAACALFLDVDHFKAVNDGFGHAMGDAVLREVARLARASLRELDACIRYGGEEIVIVLEDTREDDAAAVAERVRSNIQRFDWAGLHAGLEVTVSAGVAQRVRGETTEDFLSRADAALYAAKHDGRNCVRRARPAQHPATPAA
jgi:two-component system cell cycle response regulator